MDLKVIAGSDRRIWGLASSPDPDRENDSITRAAMEEALAFFMRHPILHLYHTERPVGIVSRAWFKGDDLFIEGKIWDGPDLDDVWNLIQRGILTQWSIKGRPRKRTGGSCPLPPALRTSPCSIESLWLDSISICPKGTAMNQKTFADVVKGMIQKASTSTNTSLIHATPDGVCRGRKKQEIKKMADPNETPPANPPEGGSGSDPIEERLARIEARLDALEGAQSGPGENLDDTPDLQKARTELEAMRAEMDALKKAIVTGRNPIIVPGEQPPQSRNPAVSNVKAFGGLK